ncbi:hypothetical protein CGMCC3_g2573 [Colletotrichum fructicola]|nr:uncharacterized protein CGMCC3_g2573 [Colletotrichum fructicola]KAE9581505.1 hypothetical protein CGMCC3_g2573 [Colletotrichum fructicola]
MKFYAPVVGLLLLQTASLVTGACTCLSVTPGKRDDNTPAAQRCCAKLGAKMSGDLCSASQQQMKDCCSTEAEGPGVRSAGVRCVG